MKRKPMVMKRGNENKTKYKESQERRRYGLKRDNPPGIKRDQPRISVMLNAHLYFFHNVFVMAIPVKKVFCLVVYHKREGIKANSVYRTMRGAKIAFSRIFNKKNFTHIKPEWSPLYEAEYGRYPALIRNAMEDTCLQN